MNVSVIDKTVRPLRWAASVRGRFSRQPRRFLSSERAITFDYALWPSHAPP